MALSTRPSPPAGDSLRVTSTVTPPAAPKRAATRSAEKPSSTASPIPAATHGAKRADPAPGATPPAHGVAGVSAVGAMALPLLRGTTRREVLKWDAMLVRIEKEGHALSGLANQIEEALTSRGLLGLTRDSAAWRQLAAKYAQNLLQQFDALVKKFDRAAWAAGNQGRIAQQALRQLGPGEARALIGRETLQSNLLRNVYGGDPVAFARVAVALDDEYWVAHLRQTDRVWAELEATQSEHHALLRRIDTALGRTRNPLAPASTFSVETRSRAWYDAAREKCAALYRDFQAADARRRAAVTAFNTERVTAHEALRALGQEKVRALAPHLPLRSREVIKELVRVGGDPVREMLASEPVTGAQVIKLPSARRPAASSAASGGISAQTETAPAPKKHAGTGQTPKAEGTNAETANAEAPNAEAPKAHGASAATSSAKPSETQGLHGQRHAAGQSKASPAAAREPATSVGAANKPEVHTIAPADAPSASSQAKSLASVGEAKVVGAGAGETRAAAVLQKAREEIAQILARGGEVTAAMLQNAKLRVGKRLQDFVLIDLRGGEVVATLWGWRRVVGSARGVAFTCNVIKIGAKFLGPLLVISEGPLIEDTIDEFAPKVVAEAKAVIATATTETKLLAQQLHGSEGYAARAQRSVRPFGATSRVIPPGGMSTAQDAALGFMVSDLVHDVYSQVQDNRAAAARANAAREDRLVAKINTAQTPSEVALAVLEVAHSVLADAAGYTYRLPEVKFLRNLVSLGADGNNRSNLEKAQQTHLKEQLGRASRALSELQKCNASASPAGAKLATTLKHIIAAAKFALRETQSAEAYKGDRDVPGYAGIQAELTEANHLVRAEARSANQGQPPPNTSAKVPIDNV